jgi:hypothetical protein
MRSSSQQSPVHVPCYEGNVTGPALKRTSLCSLVVVLGIATVLRVAAARGDLWLDELWSLSFAREAVTPLDIWMGIHHDNNHILNTFALFITVKLLGGHGPAVVYRIVPLLSGLAIVPLLFHVRRTDSHVNGLGAGWYVLVLGAISYLAITYSSEARGYAPAALCSVLAYMRVRDCRISSTADRLIFSIWCVLGFLSHLTFLFVYAGLVAWTALLAWKDQRLSWARWLALHLVPVAFLAAEYIVDARHLVYGGGLPVPTSAVLARILSLALGGPDAGPILILTVTCTVVLIAIGAALSIRADTAEGAFHIVAIALAPTAVLLVYQPRYMDVRYFFVLLPFAWILMDRAFVFLATKDITVQLACCVVLAVSIAGNGAHVLPLIQQGRGHYSAAVSMMAAQTSDPVLTVGSDEDFPNRIVLSYYAETVAREKRIEYVRARDWSERSPVWYVSRSIEYPSDVVSPNIMVHGRVFELVRSFPYGGISGWNWSVYRLRGIVKLRPWLAE